jgi:hypothetical protein
LWTLESVTSIAVSPSCTEDVVNIQTWICSCFINCTRFSYEHCVCLVKIGVVNSLLKLLEKHVDEMKLKKKKNEWRCSRESINSIFQHNQ